MKSFNSICSIDTAITISQINKILTREMKKKSKKEDIENLHPTQAKSLFLLNEKGALRLSDLAHELSLTKPTVTVLVQKLEEKGHIKRIACPNDKRCSKIDLTSKGKDFLNRFLEVGHQINQQLFREISEEEICNCITTLKKMINNY